MNLLLKLAVMSAVTLTVAVTQICVFIVKQFLYIVLFQRSFTHNLRSEFQRKNLCFKHDTPTVFVCSQVVTMSHLSAYLCLPVLLKCLVTSKERDILGFRIDVDFTVYAVLCSEK